MRIFVSFLVFVLGLVAGSPSPTTVSENPEVAGLMRTVDFATSLVFCVGSILNNRSVLTAARCVDSDPANRWRFRVGSSKWNSGGDIYYVARIILYEGWDEWAVMGDLAILQSSVAIAYNDAVQPGTFAGPDYVVSSPLLRIVGWGYVSFPLWEPAIYEEIREVNIQGLELEECRSHYSAEGFWLRDTQICTGYRGEDAATRDVCFGEPGSPVFHNNVIYGVRSYGLNCNQGRTPTISTRVGSYIDWLSANA